MSGYLNSSLKSLYKSVERAKKREYGERVREVEHGSFTPLIFSACGGMASEDTVFIKKLAAALAEKSFEPYSHVSAGSVALSPFLWPDPPLAA